MSWWPFKRRKKRFLRVGDVLPEGAEDGSYGAFIAYDPKTRIITSIFIP